MSIYDKNGNLNTAGIHSALTKEHPCKRLPNNPRCRGTTRGLWDYCTSCRFLKIRDRGERDVRRAGKTDRSVRVEGGYEELRAYVRRIEGTL